MIYIYSKKANRTLCLLICMLFFIMSSYVAFADSLHKGQVYGTYKENTIKISGNGVLKDKQFTVEELENLKDGKVNAVYTMQTLVEPHNGEYSGISVPYLLNKAVGLKDTAKKVKFVCVDGVSMEFTIEEIEKDYVNSVDNSKLKMLLAYAKDGHPLVPEKNDKGYIKEAENDGGPIRLIVGQAEKGERNSPKCLKNIKEIIVSTSEKKADFKDVGQFYNWANDAINYLAEKDIMNGATSEKFEPDKPLTRAQVSVILTKALNLKINHKVKNPWYGPYVQAAVDKGLIEDYNDKSFKPNEAVNRQEMAVMLVKAMGMENEAKKRSGEKMKYKDKEKIPSMERGYIEIAEEKGLLENIAVGYFCGSKVCNRAEAAVMVYRMIKQIESNK